MPKKTLQPEIEIKLRIEDVAAIRRRLKQIGARQIVQRTFESNTLYDSPQNDFRRRGRLLRLRIEESTRSNGQSPKGESAAVLTYKAPPRTLGQLGSAIQQLPFRRHFKVRDEYEVSLPSADAQEMDTILHSLGVRPVFRYEKVRTTYALPKVRGLKIELDETPIGPYLELEGPVKGIHLAARLLGFAKTDYLKATYGALYLADCRRRGLKPGDMIFPRKKLR